MNSTELGWVAGLLEGEGSFLVRNEHTARISCGMTDRDVIERLQSLCGGNVYLQKNKAKEYYKDVWVWNVAGDSAAILMYQVRPHMGRRRSEKIDQILFDHIVYQSDKRDKKKILTRKMHIVLEDREKTGDSLRTLAKRYNISHVTVKNYLYQARQSRRSDTGDSDTDC